MFFQDTVSVHRPGFYAERFYVYVRQLPGGVGQGQDCSALPSKEDMASVVPDSGPRDHWAGSGEVLSVSDVRLEQRLTASSTSSLGTPRSPRL